MDKRSGTDLPLVYLNPGQFFLGDQPTRVDTLLGSCVAVTLYHASSQIGAICHGLLPRCSCDGAGCASLGCDDCFRYVECSILSMLALFQARGVVVHQLEAKVFGGADMLPVNNPDNSIGRQNVRIAQRVLDNERVRLQAADVGGERGRKLRFLTHTGEVFLRRMRRHASHRSE